jgi:UDP-N-acetyl-D-mannosaminuronic acid dehydrogenase
MAFKADVDDARDSLSFKLKELLEMEAKRVLCSDPFLRSPEFVSTESAVAESDIVVIAAPHSCYRALEVGNRPVIDVWNVLGRGTHL